MILKLVVPHVNRMIPGAAVIRWHAAEGQAVTYGDDLLDLEAELAGRSIRPLADRITTMTEGKRMGIGDVLDMENRTPGPTVSVRVTASDAGFLRKICVPEGGYRDVGGLLAILTTSENESIGLSDQDVAKASLFRVVPNMI